MVDACLTLINGTKPFISALLSKRHCKLTKWHCGVRDTARYHSLFCNITIISVNFSVVGRAGDTVLLLLTLVLSCPEKYLIWRLLLSFYYMKKIWCGSSKFDQIFEKLGCWGDNLNSSRRAVGLIQQNCLFSTCRGYVVLGRKGLVFQKK